MSIENPRQEADTPRPAVDDADQPDGIDDDSFDLPDISRAAARVNEFLAWYGDGRLYPCVLPGTEDEMPPLFARDLQALTNVALAPPSDAVKLGDVEALRAELFAEVREVEAERNEQELRALNAERERDALRADYQAAQVTNAPLKRQLVEIRTVLDDPKYAAPKSGREVHRNNDDKLDRIEAILDREPGREEPAKFLPIRKADVEAEILPGRNLGDDMERRRPAFKAWVQAEMIARAESEPGRNE